MSINRVMLTGNLTREPEKRSTQTGTSLLRMGVAVNDRRYNAQKETFEDAPNFIECVLFGKRADSLEQYLHKGSKVAIEGKLRWSSWEANDGSKRSKIEVVIDDIEFLSPRANGASAQSAPQPQAQSAPQAPVASAPAPSAPQPQATTTFGASGTGADTAYGTPAPSAPAPAAPSVETETINGASDSDMYGSEIPF